MRRLLQLYLPVLFPSWRFFKEIEPSARVEYRIDGGAWVEATARPARVSPWAMLGRLCWNPAWNETLFLVSCAERIVLEPGPHPVAEINARIARRVAGEGMLQFRLVFLVREGEAIAAHVDYVSDPVALGALRR